MACMSLCFAAVQQQMMSWNQQIATWFQRSDLLVLDGRSANKLSLFVEGSVLPEPSTYALMGVGLAALAWWRTKN